MTLEEKTYQLIHQKGEVTLLLCSLHFVIQVKISTLKC